jgi:hypothetical protein
VVGSKKAIVVSVVLAGDGMGESVDRGTLVVGEVFAVARGVANGEDEQAAKRRTPTSATIVVSGNRLA